MLQLLTLATDLNLKPQVIYSLLHQFELLVRAVAMWLEATLVHVHQHYIVSPGSPVSRGCSWKYFRLEDLSLLFHQAPVHLPTSF